MVMQKIFEVAVKYLVLEKYERLDQWTVLAKIIDVAAWSIDVLKSSWKDGYTTPVQCGNVREGWSHGEAGDGVLVAELEEFSAYRFLV